MKLKLNIKKVKKDLIQQWNNKYDSQLTIPSDQFGSFYTNKQLFLSGTKNPAMARFPLEPPPKKTKNLYGGLK